MIEKTDFPYTLGGYVEQQNYKGFDIAVSIRRYKGISAYVISSEKRLIREESATFADKEDMFRWGREAVDRYLEQQERRKEENAVKRADYYKKKARVAALKAFNAAMYFSDIKDGLYDKAKGFFEYELDKEHAKIRGKHLILYKAFAIMFFVIKKETASFPIFLSGNGKLTYWKLPGHA